MICSFCSQWNPKSAVRCVFCGNRRDDSEDATKAGRHNMSAEQIENVSRLTRTVANRRGSGARLHSNPLEDFLARPGVLKTVGVAAVALVLLALASHARGCF